MSAQRRPDVTPDEYDDLVRALGAVAWSDLQHAYGPAVDVPALLLLVVTGAERARHQAWYELWGNIHHQGTVYPATGAAVPFLAAVASSPRHPDRVNALSLLREVSLGDGVAAPGARAAVEDELNVLLTGWADQPPLVQRALLLLASAFPSRPARCPELADLVPDHLQQAWDELVQAAGDPRRLADSDSVLDRYDELERWALAGWNEGPPPQG